MVRFSEIHGFTMRAESLGRVQPPIVEGSAGSMIELVATRGQEVGVDTVIGGVSFLTPWTFWARK